MDIPCSCLDEYKSYRIDIWINKELSFYSSSPYFRPFFLLSFFVIFSHFPRTPPCNCLLGHVEKNTPKITNISTPPNLRQRQTISRHTLVFFWDRCVRGGFATWWGVAGDGGRWFGGILGWFRFFPIFSFSLTLLLIFMPQLIRLNDLIIYWFIELMNLIDLIVYPYKSSICTIPVCFSFVVRYIIAFCSLFIAIFSLRFFTLFFC